MQAPTSAAHFDVAQLTHASPPMPHSAEQLPPTQVETGKTLSTAPAQPDATHRSQQGPTLTPPCVNCGASAAGQFCTQERTLLHVLSPWPVMDKSAHVSKLFA